MAWVSPPVYSVGQVLTATAMNNISGDLGEIWREIAYAEFTANVSVTGAVGSPTTVVSSGAITYSATPILIEIVLPGLTKGTTNIVAELYDATTTMGVVASSTSTIGLQEFFKGRRLTPTAASHTYNVKAYVDAGTGAVQTGTGGVSGGDMPGYIRIMQKGS